MPGELLRLAAPADALALGRLKVRAWRAAYAGLLPGVLLAALDPVEEAAAWAAYLEDLPPHDRLWVVAGPAGLLGFARTGPVAYPDLPRGTGELHGLYVEPDRIGTGLGRALLTHAVDDLAARGFAAAALWHFVGNARAAAVYERAGFRLGGAVRSSEFEVDEVRRHRLLP